MSLPKDPRKILFFNSFLSEFDNVLTLDVAPFYTTETIFFQQQQKKCQKALVNNSQLRQVMEI